MVLAPADRMAELAGPAVGTAAADPFGGEDVSASAPAPSARDPFGGEDLFASAPAPAPLSPPAAAVAPPAAAAPRDSSPVAAVDTAMDAAVDTGAAAVDDPFGSDHVFAAAPTIKPAVLAALPAGSGERLDPIFCFKNKNTPASTFLKCIACWSTRTGVHVQLACVSRCRSTTVSPFPSFFFIFSIEL